MILYGLFVIIFTVIMGIGEMKWVIAGDLKYFK